MACKDKLFLNAKNKTIIAKNKKLPDAEQKELLTDADIDKDWVLPEWCTWKINFDYLFFMSLRQPKENVGDDDGVDSEGDDEECSNGDASSTKKLKAVKKRLRSMISESPTKKKQKEPTKKEKISF